MEVIEGGGQAVEAIVEGEIMEVIEGENKRLTFDLAMPDKIARTCCRECFSRWRLSRYSFCVFLRSFFILSLPRACTALWLNLPGNLCVIR